MPMQVLSTCKRALRFAQEPRDTWRVSAKENYRKGHPAQQRHHAFQLMHLLFCPDHACGLLHCTFHFRDSSRDRCDVTCDM